MVHCVILVLDAMDFENPSNRKHMWYTKLREAIESFRAIDKLEPVRVVVVYTKIDLLFDKRSDWLQIYKQPRAQPLLTAASIFGVQQKDVFFAKNYWKEKRDYDLEALALEPFAQAVLQGQTFKVQYERRRILDNKKDKTSTSTRNVQKRS
eukprot:TRINITY_DN1243_c0_g2_i1.p1 TRINITY_DN1243_c0_g2~~TRINITY_DN1243_c0_g2_i1.p1  ORF type:complete len:151 (-),score=18.18 TRINITY_DN1243_c0_g2_i1:111-563(-)